MNPCLSTVMPVGEEQMGISSPKGHICTKISMFKEAIEMKRHFKDIWVQFCSDTQDSNGRGLCGHTFTSPCIEKKGQSVTRGDQASSHHFIVQVYIATHSPDTCSAPQTEKRNSSLRQMGKNGRQCRLHCFQSADA